MEQDWEWTLLHHIPQQIPNIGQIFGNVIGSWAYQIDDSS